MVTFKALDELGKVFATLDSAETFFGIQERGGSPAQHHLRFIPAFDPFGPRVGSSKAALDQIGRVEALDKGLLQSKPRYRKGFFQSFFEAACCAGTKALQPFHTGSQFLERRFGTALGPGCPQTPGRLASFFQGQMVQNITQLMDSAALNQRPLAKDLSDPNGS